MSMKQRLICKESVNKMNSTEEASKLMVAMVMKGLMVLFVELLGPSTPDPCPACMRLSLQK
jgi:hypothetical protein